MTRKQIRDDLLRKVWFEDPDRVPGYVLDDVTTEVNRALQTLWALPSRDWFRRQQIEIALVSGTNRYELALNIQRVLGITRLNGSALRPAKTRGDIENYGRRYLGELSETPGTPMIYWVEQLASGDASDSAAAFLWLAPTPNAGATLTLQTSTEAPNYSNADLTSEEEGIPMPHGYVESLFLPVARYFVSRSHWFRDAARVDELRADATSAFAALGMVAPWETTESEPAGSAAVSS